MSIFGMFGHHEREPIEPEFEEHEEGPYNTNTGEELKDHFAELEKYGYKPEWVEHPDERGNLRWYIIYQKPKTNDPRLNH